MRRPQNTINLLVLACLLACNGLYAGNKGTITKLAKEAIESASKEVKDTNKQVINAAQAAAEMAEKASAARSLSNAMDPQSTIANAPKKNLSDKLRIRQSRDQEGTNNVEKSRNQNTRDKEVENDVSSMPNSLTTKTNIPFRPIEKISDSREIVELGPDIAVVRSDNGHFKMIVKDKTGNFKTVESKGPLRKVTVRNGAKVSANGTFIAFSDLPDSTKDLLYKNLEKWDNPRTLGCANGVCKFLNASGIESGASSSIGDEILTSKVLEKFLKDENITAGGQNLTVRVFKTSDKSALDLIDDAKGLDRKVIVSYGGVAVLWAGAIVYVVYSGAELLYFIISDFIPGEETTEGSETLIQSTSP